MIYGSGMVLVRSESGQLLMIPQQALAQMQAQAQGGMAPRTATPTSVPPVQVGSSHSLRRSIIYDLHHVQASTSKNMFSFSVSTK